MKKIILISLQLTIISNFLIAQIPAYNWLVNYGNSLNDNAQSIALDNSGNVYVTGTINGIVDLDPTGGTYNITSYAGSNDFYIAKYDSLGNIIWGFRRGSSGYDDARKILITSNNDIIIVGQFSGSFDFDPGSSTTTLNAGTNSDGFVAKYDSAGNFIWAFDLGDQSYYDLAVNADLDPNDNVYVIGYFEGTVDFNPGTGTANLSSTNGASFVAKYDSSGNYSWAFKIESNSSISILAISVDHLSNVYITGSFDGTADFNPSTSVFNLSSINGDEIFLAKYSAASTFIWAYQLGSGGDDVGVDVNAKTTGRIYLTGHIAGTCDFDLTAGSYLVFTSGAINGFLASYDVNAALQWAFGIGQPGGGSQGCATNTDVNGNVFLTGSFAGTIDFDPSANVDTISAPLSFTSGFIAKYDNSGAYQYAVKLESSGHTYPSDISIDLNNNIYISGLFSNTCDFDPSSNNTNITSNGLDDAFIVKYSYSATGIETISENDNINVYPNPFNSVIKVTGVFPKSNIKIFNTMGVLIKEFLANSDNVFVDLQNVPKGIYLMQIANKDKTFSKKLMKE